MADPPTVVHIHRPPPMNRVHPLSTVLLNKANIHLLHTKQLLCLAPHHNKSLSPTGQGKFNPISFIMKSLYMTVSRPKPGPRPLPYSSSPVFSRNLFPQHHHLPRRNLFTTNTPMAPNSTLCCTHRGHFHLHQTNPTINTFSSSFLSRQPHRVGHPW